ncbi:MAG: peptidase C69 [archaeon]|nr:peptidase C69 [archaeon]
MCDTLVAIGSACKDGNVIFGKNSDRPSDEVQLVTYNPSKQFSKGTQVNCTHISIPQVTQTAAILLSQPYWMWGAEMGANEYGVVIGNEAVWTTLPIRPEGLLGMDLLRLGLERGNTAKEALNIITSLLEDFGQGGTCSIDGGMTYHNSFIIADLNEAWILETADKLWVAERIIDGVRNISNSLSIVSAGDLRCNGLFDYVFEQELCKDEESFNFAQIFDNSWSSHLSPYSREGRCNFFLQEKSGNITPQLMAEILRDHEGGVCMHGGFLSTGSQISILEEDNNNHFFTATAPPCKSIFHPYEFDDRCFGLTPSGSYNNINQDWIWLKHQITLHRNPNLNNIKNQDKMEKLKKLEQINFNLINSKVNSIQDRINYHNYSIKEFKTILDIK